MPCQDVTEVVRLTVDNDDRVLSYELLKQTCGGAVAGRGLVRDAVKLRTIDDILAITPKDILDVSRHKSTVNEYLLLKHLFAIQATLAAFRGTETAHEPGMLQIESVDYAPGTTHIQARIKLDLLTEKIKACGLCGDSCGRTE